MHPTLANLIIALEPTPIGNGVYRAGQPLDGGNHLFGGQVLAQALAAANRFVGGSLANSLHAYFLNRGNAQDPIEYAVAELRHSRTFQTVEVTATQTGTRILKLAASYHAAEPGPTHQIPMDDVGPPRGEGYERALLRAMTPAGFEDDGMPFELPVEIRGVGGIGLFNTEINPPQSRCWMRVRDALPDDPALHQCLFAYSSDYAIMAPALNPHPFPVTSLQSASLDHAIWFHREFRMDEWLLFELDSPVAHGARGIGRGLLYDREGMLVATCAQEALLRPLRASKSSST
jgi:acyl-CoA thioesterase-2